HRTSAQQHRPSPHTRRRLYSKFAGDDDALDHGSTVPQARNTDAPARIDRARGARHHRVPLQPADEPRSVVMDPRLMSPLLWDEISRALVGMVLFLGLAVTAGLALLCGHAIIPSLVSTEDVPPATATFRWIFYPIFGASLAITVYALAQALIVTVGVL